MKNKLKLTIMSSFLVFSNLYGIGMTDSEFIAKNKVIDKTEIITYTYDFGTNKSDGGVSEIATSTVTDASNLVKSKLTESGVYKVEVKYHYKNSELTNTNINNIHTFKNINTNSFIGSKEEKNLSNSFNVSFHYGENGTGQTIGMISNTQGIGEIMSVSTVENTKEKYVSFIGQKFNGMAFYGDKIKEMCKNKETIPEYLVLKTDMITNYLNLFKGEKGIFNNSPDLTGSGTTLTQLKDIFKNQSVAISLSSLGINNDSCVDILDDSVNVYEKLSNINLFNSDGTVNLDNKNLENNRLRMAFIMADVMYDTYSDEAYLRYDDHWDTKSGTYCRKKVKYIGCVKHRMWQAFSHSNSMDKIISKRYIDDNIVFNDDLIKKNELTNISGMFKQKPFNRKDSILPNSISKNFLIISDVTPPSDFTELTPSTVPDERNPSTYDIERHEDKGWGILEWIIVVVVVVIAIAVASPAVLGFIAEFVGMSTLITGVALMSGAIFLIGLGDFETKLANGKSIAMYIDNSNLIPDNLKEDFDSVTNLNQINTLLNTANSLKILNENENDSDSITSSYNDKYLSVINKQYFHIEDISKFNKLFMRQFNKSDNNIFETGDVHGTQVANEDYFTKTDNNIPSDVSILNGYFLYENTKFTEADRDVFYSLGNSIRYGTSGTTAGYNAFRPQILNSMTLDFDVLIDREYKNIIKNFYTDGSLNVSETD